jgi:S1-C subfamily serine protease
VNGEPVTLSDVIDAVRPCIVQITCTLLGLTKDELEALGGRAVVSRPLGTGFLVDDQGHVVTAQHVLKGAKDVAADFPHADIHIGIGLAYPNSDQLRGNFRVTPFEVLEEDNEHDLALLRMRVNPFSGEIDAGIEVDGRTVKPSYGVSSLRTRRPRDGDPICVSGYPLGEPVMVTNGGMVASSWSVQLDDYSNLRDVYLGDVQSNPGNSGGPVYDSTDGAVLGVLVAGRLTDVVAGRKPLIINGLKVRADAGLSLIVPTKYVVSVLDRNHVRWASAD